MKKIVFLSFLQALIIASVSFGYGAEAPLYEISRDPFDFSAVKETLLEEPESTEFTLRATLVADKHSIAALNSKILAEGDEINGYTVVTIREDEVVLKREQQVIIVSMTPPANGTDQ